MFGFFGKGIITQPAPVQPALSPTTQTASSEPMVISPIAPISPIPEPKPQVDPEEEQIRAHLAMVKWQIENQKAKKEAKIQALREKQAKQAAYGRDTVQKRPPKAGYATEAEKIMGGSTGYYKPPTASGLGYFGTVQTLAQDVNTARKDVEKALAIVKELSKDVKAGVAPRSDLERALKELERKINRTKQLSQAAKGLDGYGESKKNPWWILPVIGVIAFIALRPRG